MVYIARSVQREPLDQTGLKNGGDAILMAMDNRYNNKADRWGPQGPSGLYVGSSSPMCQRHVSRFGDSPSGAF